MDQTPSNHDLKYRTLDIQDSVDLQCAVVDCPPLTLHTPYTYWVILSRSSELCIGAWQQDEFVGFAMAIPTLRNRVFVWQIGVRPAFRGRQIGQSLLERVWLAAEQSGFSSLETSVAPNNQASTATFASFAKSHGFGFEVAGETVCRDPAGDIVEREIEYLLKPLSNSASESFREDQ